MDVTLALKALADETRMKIVALLLKHNYCVRALAGELGVSEAAVSQHLKVLREAGLLAGEKKGYYMHYDLNRDMLRALANEITALASIEREPCAPEKDGCHEKEKAGCHNHAEGGCSDEVKEFCHGHAREGEAACCDCHN